MPHCRQRRQHGNYGEHINVAAVTAAMGRSGEGVDHDRSLNSSCHSELSDGEDVAEGEGEGMDEVVEEEAVISLTTSMSFKPISKESVLLVMAHGSSVYLKGKVEVKVLAGEVEVLGHSILPSTEFTRIYSPRGYSLLDLAARRAAPPADLVERAVAEGLAFEQAREVAGDCVLVVRRLDEAWTRYLHRQLNMHTKMNLLGRDQHVPGAEQGEEVAAAERALDCNLVPPSARHLRLFRAGEDWPVAETSLGLTRGQGAVPRLLVAGGKGVGKSTFLRWLANRLLVSGPFLLLDLDPGQAELGLPTYLTLATVSAPLLGPNFAQVDRQAELRVCLGDINVSNCPGRFLQCVRRLVDMVDSEERLRGLGVVVNTMGWPRGVGLMLLVDTIRLVRPTTVVQIHSRFHRKNLPFSLTPETVAATRESWSGRPAPSGLAFNLLEFLAVPEREEARDMRTRDGWGLPDPRLTRQMVVVAALGRLGGLHTLPVYRVALQQVALHVAHAKVPPEGLLAAVNLAVVDLCKVEERQVRRAVTPGLYSTLHRAPVAASLGWGVVRSIDAEAGVIYLATGAEPDQVQRANCLVAGACRLPDSLLTCQGKAPYLATGPGHPLDLPWQRNFKPRGHAQPQ